MFNQNWTLRVVVLLSYEQPRREEYVSASKSQEFGIERAQGIRLLSLVRIWDKGFRVCGLCFGVWGLGVRVQGVTGIGIEGWMFQ